MTLPALLPVGTLADRLGDPAVRLFDATVRLERPPGGGPYAIVSGRDEYRRARLPGAAFADLAGDLADPATPHAFGLPSAERFAAAAGALGIGPGIHVVAYAQESPMWATRLWWLLRFFGFDAVSVLDGGREGWRAAGLPLQAGEHAHPPEEFTARLRPELLAVRADVEAATAAGGTRLVCGLRPPVYRGEEASSSARPGHIPGSVNVPWTALADDTGRFRPAADRSAALAAGGLLSGEPVIAYCGGGISATVDVFALHLAGREARLYDGALSEWSADPSLPLELG